MEKAVDFAVVGAGMAGASAAYELAAHGTVKVFEMEATAGHHSTGRSAALYTECDGLPPLRRLAMASKEFLLNLTDRGIEELQTLAEVGSVTISAPVEVLDDIAGAVNSQLDVVTIAIPFHRGRDYLRVAIESVLAQASPDWRLLLVDDSGGGHDAEEVAATFDDDRVVVHRNPANLGMVASWNRCLELAEGDLVTLLHADDLLEPGYVASMQELSRCHPDAAAFFCSARIIDAEGRARFSFADAIKGVFVPGGSDDIVLSGRSSVRALMRGNFIMCPTLCYRRSLLAG